jgi:hypothetical protein
LIVAESYRNRLTAFDIAPDGALTNRRVWAETPGDHPDGICLDAEGALWFADVGNKHCVRVREGGDVVDKVDVDRGGFACALSRGAQPRLFVVGQVWGAPDSTTPTGHVMALHVMAFPRRLRERGGRDCSTTTSCLSRDTPAPSCASTADERQTLSPPEHETRGRCGGSNRMGGPCVQGQGENHLVQRRQGMRGKLARASETSATAAMLLRAVDAAELADVLPSTVGRDVLIREARPHPRGTSSSRSPGTGPRPAVKSAMRMSERRRWSGHGRDVRSERRIPTRTMSSYVPRTHACWGCLPSTTKPAFSYARIAAM